MFSAIKNVIRSNRRAVMTAIPLLFVNTVAFGGQYGYIRDHIHWPMIGQVVFAAALESIALFLTYMAHEALMAEDSAYGLRILSYGFGLIIGALNYSHYSAPGLRPTFPAIATGLMSVTSPFLWGIYSRRNSRDALKAKGLIESRAVKLGALRWIMWFRPSWHVFRSAVWSGENRPDAAINEWENAQTRKEAEEIAATEARQERITIETARTKAEAVRIAIAELGIDTAAPAVAEWLRERGKPVDTAYVRAIKSQMNRKPVGTVLALPSGRAGTDSR